MILSVILYHAVVIYKFGAKTHRKTVSRRLERVLNVKMNINRQNNYQWPY